MNVRTIVCMYQPFVLKQKIEVYENTNLINKLLVKTREIPDEIFFLTQDMPITEILLAGGKKFCQSIAAKLKEKGIDDTISIRII